VAILTINCFMKKVLQLTISLLITIFTAGSLYAQSEIYPTITKRFLLAKERSYQLTATKADVNTVLDFCSDTVKYDHILSPDKKFSFSEKDQWRSGVISHLGETRGVKLGLSKFIARQNVVIAEYTLYREFKTNKGWQNSTGTIVSVIEFNKANKISRLTDYL